MNLHWFHSIRVDMTPRSRMTTITSAPASPRIMAGPYLRAAPGSHEAMDLPSAPALSAEELLLEVQLHEGRLAGLRVIRHHVPVWTTEIYIRDPGEIG